MAVQVFDRAVSRTLRAEVVDMIRDAIVTGQLKPGERLKESLLASQMSRSLRAQIQVLFLQRFQASDWVLETVDTGHSAILAALRAGDAQQFSEINKEINARVAEEYVQVIRSLAG